MTASTVWVCLADPETQRGTVQYQDLTLPCVLGKGGILPAEQKREGDGASPAGCYPLRWVFYRPDRLATPATRLLSLPLTPEMGWCDDPTDPAYNRLVPLPFAASHEQLWRDDGLYDLILVLGHNDAPPRPGWGSAIFLHIARPGYLPTEGCIALAKDDVLALLARLNPEDSLTIVQPTKTPLVTPTSRGHEYEDR